MYVCHLALFHYYFEAQYYSYYYLTLYVQLCFYLFTKIQIKKCIHLICFKSNILLYNRQIIPISYLGDATIIKSYRSEIILSTGAGVPFKWI